MSRPTLLNPRVGTQDLATEATARNTAITNAVNALVAAAPGALDTLKELADALGDDPNFATTMTTALAGKASTTALTSEATSRLAADLLAAARNPDVLVAGAVTRDSNGAATVAAVVWPDGSPGTYTADALSSAFPGAVDGYHITYGSPVTKTYTQPTITRDAATGAATNVPAIAVT